MKTIIVKIRIYKGTEILKNDKGEVRNENQTVTLKHDSQEWHNYLGKMSRSGYGVAQVVEAFEDKGMDKEYKTTYEKINGADISIINAEIQEALKKDKIAETPEQTEIRELKERIDKMEDKKSPAPVTKVAPPVDNTPDINEELEAAKAKYAELFGKPPHHMAQLKGINEKIAKKLKESK